MKSHVAFLTSFPCALTQELGIIKFQAPLIDVSKYAVYSHDEDSQACLPPISQKPRNPRPQSPNCKNPYDPCIPFKQTFGVLNIQLYAEATFAVASCTGCARSGRSMPCSSTTFSTPSCKYLFWASTPLSSLLMPPPQKRGQDSKSRNSSSSGSRIHS